MKYWYVVALAGFRSFCLLNGQGTVLSAAKRLNCLLDGSGMLGSSWDW